MEGIQNQVNPSTLDLSFIDNDLLEKTLESRYEFNNAMRVIYGDDIEDKFEEFSTKDAVVWVDPLDGTTEFVNGNLSGVTVLIGLAIKGIPKIGVVHNPYMTNDATCNGMTIFGTQEHGAFRLDYDPKKDIKEQLKRQATYLEPFDIYKEINDDYNVRVACSLSHFNEKFTAALEKIKPVEVHRLGGAGNKVNRIALDEADCYFQPRGGLSFWDTCAPEVIVRAMGGLMHKMPDDTCVGEFDRPKRILYDFAKNGKSVKLPAFSIGKTPKV